MKRLLLTLAFLFGGAVFAADPTPPVPAPKVAVDYKDAFLGFALEKAKTYSGAIEGAVSKAVDTVQTEAPLLVAEYVRYRFWYHLLHCLIPILFVLAVLLPAIFMKAELCDPFFSSASGHTLLRWGFIILTGLMSMIAFFTLFVDSPSDMRGHPGEPAHFYSLVKITTAPRVYMIEQVLSLVKKD